VQNGYTVLNTVKTTVLPPSLISHTTVGLLKLRTTETKPNSNLTTNPNRNLTEL